MTIKVIILSAFCLLMAILPVKANPDDLSVAGKNIFTSRCASCHAINKIMTGPALAGVAERRSIEWIVNFVHSSQTLIKRNDKEAVALFEQFNKIPMPDHADLSDGDIKNIIAYIKSASQSTGDKAPFSKPSKRMPDYLPLSISKDYPVFVIFLAALLLLIASMIFAVQARTIKRH